MSVLFVVFFKQKTAYEMRISDWSSDVCSSDLREGAPLQWRRMLDFMVDPGVPPARVIAIVEDEMRELSIPNVARTPAPSCVLKRFEIGRASCRERVCQYV